MDPLCYHFWMLHGVGAERGEDAGLLIAVLKILGCPVLPRDFTLPAQMPNDLRSPRVSSLVVAFLHGNQQPRWDEVTTLHPSQAKDTSYERLLPRCGCVVGLMFCLKMLCWPDSIPQTLELGLPMPHEGSFLNSLPAI